MIVDGFLLGGGGVGFGRYKVEPLLFKSMYKHPIARGPFDS
jgi:hypothetical protein